MALRYSSNWPIWLVLLFLANLYKEFSQMSKCYDVVKDFVSIKLLAHFNLSFYYYRWNAFVFLAQQQLKWWCHRLRNTAALSTNGNELTSYVTRRLRINMTVSIRCAQIIHLIEQFKLLEPLYINSTPLLFYSIHGCYCCIFWEAGCLFVYMTFPPTFWRNTAQPY